jgi:hypothetical protein
MGGKPRKRPTATTPERKLIVCETIVAYALHLRVLGPNEAPSYSGHCKPAPRTLCDKPVGWDTRIPLGQENCRHCIATNTLALSTHK